jgi:SnoaL-like domain
MKNQLPIVILDYFRADAAKDYEGLAQVFAPNACVHDESEDYVGIDAILDWKRTASTQYQYTVEPLGHEISGDNVRYRARLAGNFPGSPVDVVYTFTVAESKITYLSID